MELLVTGTMAKKSKAVATTEKTEEEELPPDIAEAKKKLEEKTGKKYKYRTAKKDMPSIQHMLVHGAPGSEGKKKTILQQLTFPLILLVLFFISLTIWVNAPHDKSKIPRGKFTLNKRRSVPQAAARSMMQPVPDEPKEEL